MKESSFVLDATADGKMTVRGDCAGRRLEIMAKKRKRKYSRSAGADVEREMHRYKRGVDAAAKHRPKKAPPLDGAKL
jgi:hypothetical protein